MSRENRVPRKYYLYLVCYHEHRAIVTVEHRREGYLTGLDVRGGMKVGATRELNRLFQQHPQDQA